MTATTAVIGTLGGLLVAGLFDVSVIKTLKFWDQQKHEQSEFHKKMEEMQKKKMEAKNYVFFIFTFYLHS